MSDNAPARWLIIVVVCSMAAVAVLLLTVGRRQSVDDPSGGAVRESSASIADDNRTAGTADPGKSPAPTVGDAAAVKPAPVYYEPKKIDPPQGADPALKPMFEAWREAVLKRQPQQIHQASNDIDSCGVRAIPWLLKIYREDDQERVRAHAVRILGRLCNKSLIDFFVEVLAVDKSEDVRYNAAWSLGRLHHEGAIEDLRRAASNDPSEKVRSEASKAIAEVQRQ